MSNKIRKVVGTMFFKDGKLLIDKPRKRPTYQMIGGGVEDGETTLQAAIRECHEELGKDACFDENNLLCNTVYLVKKENDFLVYTTDERAAVFGKVRTFQNEEEAYNNVLKRLRAF